MVAFLVLYFAEEFFRDGETFVGHCVPEVEVLVEVLVHSRGVANDTETEEWYVPEMADLCNSSTFHIDGKTLGILPLDDVQLVAIRNELVAGTDQAWHNTDIGFERGCYAHEPLVAPEELGEALHLSRVAIVTTNDVVVAGLFANDDIHHFEFRINTSSHAGRNDAIGMESENEVRYARSGICLADATLEQGHFVLPDPTDKKLLRTTLQRLCVLHYGCNLTIFDTHRHQYAYSLLHTH